VRENYFWFLVGPLSFWLRFQQAYFVSSVFFLSQLLNTVVCQVECLMFRSDERFVSAIHLLVSIFPTSLLSYLSLPRVKGEVR
jgi:hypothetical protein